MPAQARKGKAFRHHALAGESGVAVDQERQRFRPLDHVAKLVLLGANLAEHDRIDDLEMRRVCGQRQVDAVAVELAVRRRAEVIFDVAGAVDLVRRRRAALELVEDDAVRLVHHLAQHVEPAAMGHAERDVAQAQLAAPLDDLLESRDHRLRAVEAEPLGSRILDVEEPLEALALDQLAEDGALAFLGELDFLVGPLDALLNPGLLGRIGDMNEFEADRAAIGAPEDREHFSQGRVFEPEHMIDEDLAVVVGFLEAVGRGMELLVIPLRLEAERVEIGVEMAAHAVGADHHQRAHEVAGRAANLVLGRRRLRPSFRRLGPQLVGDRLFRRRPIAVQRVDEIALRRGRPIGFAP